MKEYSFVINDNQYTVDLISVGELTAKVKVNNMEYDVEIIRKQDEIKTPVISKKAVIMDAASKHPMTDAPANLESKLPGSIQSPLPGLITKIMVSVGDKVKVGQVLLIMEAMKMDNEIQSTTTGTVSEIKIKVDDHVLEGDILMKVSP